MARKSVHGKKVATGTGSSAGGNGPPSAYAAGIKSRDVAGDKAQLANGLPPRSSSSRFRYPPKVELVKLPNIKDTVQKERASLFIEKVRARSRGLPLAHPHRIAPARAPVPRSSAAPLPPPRRWGAADSDAPLPPFPPRHPPGRLPAASMIASVAGRSGNAARCLTSQRR